MSLNDLSHKQFQFSVYLATVPHFFPCNLSALVYQCDNSLRLAAGQLAKHMPSILIHVLFLQVSFKVDSV
jgi:hypothetical protein